MTVLVQNTEITSTFDYWRTRTNELAYSMSKGVITTDHYLGEDSLIAEGDAAITGKFTAETLQADDKLYVNTSIHVGNSTINAVTNSTSFTISNTVSSIEISIPTTVQISEGNYFLNADGGWSVVPLALSSDSITSSGTSDNILDTFSINDKSGAEYMIHTKDLTANGYAITRLLVFHDTGSAYATEYGTMFSNATSGALAAFKVDISGTNVRLIANPTRSSTLIKFSRVIV